MFDGKDLDAVLFESGRADGSGDVIGDGFDRRIVIEIGTDESNSAVDVGGLDGHVDVFSGMQSDAETSNLVFDSSLS